MKIVLEIFLLVILLFLIMTKNKSFENFDNLIESSEFKNRKIDTTIKPLFKLDAYCINLKNKPENFKFIQEEWKNYLNVTRFLAKGSCNESHKTLLAKIWREKERLNFPLVVMEDDVFRKNNFNLYWNEIKKLNEVDYVVFDCFFLKFNHNLKISPLFIGLNGNNAVGFNVYYKCFFDRFRTQEEIEIEMSGVIDQKFTQNKLFKKMTPREQVCQQVISKTSTTIKMNTKNYQNFYNHAIKQLQKQR